jgi:hypothetical protein
MRCSKQPGFYRGINYLRDCKIHPFSNIPESLLTHAQAVAPKLN